MKSKQACKRILGIFFALLLLVSAVISGRVILPAFAVGTKYTGALEDLQKDVNFKESDYPVNVQDYSLKVIQIGESVNRELFVYVYQPAATKRKLPATSISISTQINENYAPKLYKLEVLSSDGVFGKYLVKDFVLQTTNERNYDISEIFRAWNSEIDEPFTSGTTVSEVSFAVGKLFTATTEANGNISYTCTTTETIEIRNPVHGSLRYANGISPPFATYWKSDCDSWFVAFNTDKRIDKLFTATVYYISQKYQTFVPSISGVPPTTRYEEAQENYTVVTDKDKAGNNPHLWIKGEKRDWDRIQSVSEFIRTESLNAETEAAVKGKQWVLRFTETEYKETHHTSMGLDDIEINGTKVSEATILQLKFETDGIVYNLGAVDNKHTPDTNPDNPPSDQDRYEPRAFWESIKNFFTGKSKWWVYLIVAIAVLLLLPTILGLLFPAVGKFLLWLIKGVFNCVWWLVKGLWWLICLPFKGIASLIKRSKERKRK